jgi:hypothetical protein
MTVHKNSEQQSKQCNRSYLILLSFSILSYVVIDSYIDRHPSPVNECLAYSGALPQIYIALSQMMLAISK